MPIRPLLYGLLSIFVQVRTMQLLLHNVQLHISDFTMKIEVFPQIFK